MFSQRASKILDILVIFESLCCAILIKIKNLKKSKPTAWVGSAESDSRHNRLHHSRWLEEVYKAFPLFGLGHFLILLPHVFIVKKQTNKQTKNLCK